MKPLNEFVLEAVDPSKFKKNKLRFGSVCFAYDRDELPLIWVPKEYAQLMCNLYDLPNVGDMFLFRDTYYKDQFSLLRGSNFTTDLRQKEFRRRSITKYFANPIPLEVVQSRTFRYDFDDSLRKFIKEQGSNFYERELPIIHK